MYNCAKKAGKPDDWDSYRKIRSAVNKHLAERKNAHISNIIKASLENNNTNRGGEGRGGEGRGGEGRGGEGKDNEFVVSLV